MGYRRLARRERHVSVPRQVDHDCSGGSLRFGAQFSLLSGRNADTGGPARPRWAASARRRSSPCLLLLGCGGFVQMFSQDDSARLARQSRVRRDHLQGARKTRSARRTPAKKAGSTARRSRSNTRPAAPCTATRTTTSIAPIPADRENAQAILDRFALYDPAKDNRYPCWYDPANPGVCVLVRGYRWMDLAGVHRAAVVHRHRRRRLDLYGAALGEVGGTPRGVGPARRRARSFRRPAATASIPSFPRAPT